MLIAWINPGTEILPFHQVYDAVLSRNAKLKYIPTLFYENPCSTLMRSGF
jgi:hypothetical protein